MEELGNYVKLVALGAPDFIEIKGVTYCGSSGASSLTMQNVPYHEDVCAFGQVPYALCNNTSALCSRNAFAACLLHALGRGMQMICFRCLDALEASCGPAE